MESMTTKPQRSIAIIFLHLAWLFTFIVSIERVLSTRTLWFCVRLELVWFWLMMVDSYLSSKLILCYSSYSYWSYFMSNSCKVCNGSLKTVAFYYFRPLPTGVMSALLRGDFLRFLLVFLARNWRSGGFNTLSVILWFKFYFKQYY